MLAWQRTRTSTATSSEGSFAETPSGYIGPRCETRNVACLAVPSFSPQHCEALLCWRCPREIDRNRNVACATHRAFRALATASPTSKDRAQQGMEVQMKRNSPASLQSTSTAPPGPREAHNHRGVGCLRMSPFPFHISLPEDLVLPQNLRSLLRRPGQLDEAPLCPPIAPEQLVAARDEEDDVRMHGWRSHVHQSRSERFG